MRESGGTVILPMEFLVNTLYALLLYCCAVLLDPRLEFKDTKNENECRIKCKTHIEYYLT